MKTVVTMTSWTKRIDVCAAAIERFMEFQTIKPDLFYLWLAEEEFPNKSIPAELTAAIKKYDVLLRWTVKNEYCHKRWHVYPTHFEDLVISIDDDVMYQPNLVELARTCTHITNLWNLRTDARFKPMRVFMCGQCVVPPKTFPLEAYDTKYDAARMAVCPRCDECWINTFLLKDNIYVTSWAGLTTLLEAQVLPDPQAVGMYLLFTPENSKGKLFADTARYMEGKYEFELDEQQLAELIKFANYKWVQIFYHHLCL